MLFIHSLELCLTYGMQQLYDSIYTLLENVHFIQKLVNCTR